MLVFVHPIAFQLGLFTMSSYGLMLMVGLLAGWWSACRRARHDTISETRVIELGPWLMMGAILGARLLYVISYWQEDFERHSFIETLLLWKGGLVFYGGLIGAFLSTAVFARVRKVSFWGICDILAPSTALGYVFGRLGCLLNGCCYGRPCSLPWGITFPNASRIAPPQIKLHPVQIYDAMLNLLLFCGLSWFYHRKRFNGQVFALYLIGYSLMRSFVEVFRGDYPQQYVSGLITPAQFTSIFVLAAGLLLVAVLPRSRGSEFRRAEEGLIVSKGETE